MSDSEKIEGGHVMKEPEFKISKIKYYKEVVNKKEKCPGMSTRSSDRRDKRRNDRKRM